MIINDLLYEKKISKYQLARESHVPYSTVNELCNGKTRLEKCSAGTVYKISKTLDVSMEFLLEAHFEKRDDFELFKSNICHRVKDKGDINFLIETIESDEIRSFYNKKLYREALYLLAMVDYLSRVNDVDYCNDYNDIRKKSLKEKLYPFSAVLANKVTKNEEWLKNCEDEAIPEFRRFNIMESDIRNVI